MVRPVNVEELLAYIRENLPPQWYAITRPEFAPKLREQLANSEYGYLVKVVEDSDCPPDSLTMVRKDVVENGPAW